MWSHLSTNVMARIGSTEHTELFVSSWTSPMDNFGHWSYSRAGVGRSISRACLVTLNTQVCEWSMANFDLFAVTPYGRRSH